MLILKGGNQGNTFEKNNTDLSARKRSPRLSRFSNTGVLYEMTLRQLYGSV